MVKTALSVEEDVKREELYNAIMSQLEKSYILMRDYDAMPHKYGEEMLYQVESHTVQIIGLNPGITTHDVSLKMGKTPSACSQIIRKLRNKNLVTQTRNAENNREYNLHLTERGWKLFWAHEDVDHACDERKKKRFAQFSLDELNTYLKMSTIMNEEFEVDVQQAKETFNNINI